MKRTLLGLAALGLLMSACATDGGDSAPASSSSSSSASVTATSSSAAPTSSTTSAPPTDTDVVTVTGETVEPAPTQETPEPTLDLPMDTRVTVGGYRVEVGGPCGAENQGASVDDVVCQNGTWTQQ